MYAASNKLYPQGRFGTLLFLILILIKQLIKDYILTIKRRLTNPVRRDGYAIRALIELPSEARGLGHVKLEAIEVFYSRLNQIGKTSSVIT